MQQPLLRTSTAQTALHATVHMTTYPLKVTASVGDGLKILSENFIL
jgi:hypothetical protein